LFKFEENIYFKNRELKKKFIFEGLEKYPIKSEGSEIEWK
jgi:hypothetical protein